MMATGATPAPVIRLLASSRSWWARRATDPPADPPAGPRADAPGGPAPLVDDPSGWPALRTLTDRQPLKQPDTTTCGSCSLVMAHMINDPAFASTIIGPLNPDDAGTVTAFAAAVQQMHDRTGSMRDPRGGWTVPWPKFFGTQPWAVARQMSGPGGSGRNSAHYIVVPFDPRAPAGGYRTVVAAVTAGEAVPLFVGDATMARHVVLVTGHHVEPTDAVDLYDPSAGRWISVDQARFLTGELAVAGWPQAWFAVVPGG